MLLLDLHISKFLLFLLVLFVQLSGKLFAPVDTHLVLLSVVLRFPLLFGLPPLCFILFLSKVLQWYKLKVVGLNWPLIDHAYKLDGSLFLSGVLAVALE
jgi:hypothetical protein